MVKAKMPKSRIFIQCLKAFLVGGLICCLGQVVSDLGKILFELDDSSLSSFTAMVMVFLASLFTGLGIYDKLGKFAGAGSVVPITGFANSIVSPAMEFKREGLVMGVGAKLFSLAGPVLVYGITSSVIIGLLTLIFS
ncbi:MAG: stage V sporulation protein AC [Clostridia bacterium]